MCGPVRLMGSNSMESNTGSTAKPNQRVTAISTLHALLSEKLLQTKISKYLKSKKIKTLQSDEYYIDKDNVHKDTLIKKSDIIIISTPHKSYKNLKISKKKELVDIWGLIEKK